MKIKYYHNGETHEIPLQSDTPAGKRLAVRHNNQTYYAPLVPTTDSAASDLRLVFGGETLALSKAATPVAPATPFSFTVLDTNTETTLIIAEKFTEGINAYDNVLELLDEDVRTPLEELVVTDDYEMELATVEFTGSVPSQPASVTIYLNTVWSEDQALYLIFTMYETVDDYTLIEAVGQSDTSITFELPVAFIAEYLATPMTMIVLKAQE